MRTPRQPNYEKTSGVPLLMNTSQHPLAENLNIAIYLPKNKAPRRMLQDVAGCLPDEPSEEGVRLSRTSN